MLALGIGLNVTVFTVANTVLFTGFPLVERNDRIAYIDSRNNGRGCCVSYPDYQDWRSQARSFTGMGAVADLKITIEDRGGLPESYNATQVTTNAFALLGQTPILGRDFSPSDMTPGASPVAILSFGFWNADTPRTQASWDGLSRSTTCQRW